MANLLTTYALLGYLKETSNSSASIAELYIPLVKKALADYSAEHGLSEYKGRSLSEIANKIKSIFEIEIPIPILSKIMSSIKNEINDDNVFALYNDGAFIIKSYIFNEINDTIEQEQDNIVALKNDFEAYCFDNKFAGNFEELKTFILSSQIDLFTNAQSGFTDVKYYIPKYINDRLSNKAIFRIMTNIYLGGIIVSYLEQNITKRVTDAELLLDTNFIISLIDLNTEDAYQTCNQLFSLCTQLGYRFTILNSTINQIKILLSNRINDFANKDFIGSIRVADIFNACIRRGLDKTSLERIKDNLSRTIQEKGIVVIQDAQIHGIIEKAKRSSDYRELFEKRRNEESALNDTVAKLYVESKRGQNPREFVDVKCWFLHNSYSTYDYSIGRKIHERYLIGANELLVLLWLSSPAQGHQIKITDLARSGLTAYITKYRRAKNPSHEVLRNIKKRIDETTKLGLVSEKDTFNLCIRMAEGHLTHSEVVESIIAPSITDEEFANKLKEYTQEVEDMKVVQKQAADHEISKLNEKIESKDNEIADLQKRIRDIEQDKYIDN
ncbi:MAG: hypothetical protein J6S11_05925, partial [Bacteroidaceae bacterium]|nr:hypothetical protein [Bacteroidaceae bacterium]